MMNIEWPGAIAPSQDMRGRCFGVVVGIVTNNQDPEKLGRIKVKFPWLSDDDESNWARVASPMAGPQRGMYFLPEVEDEVLVMFEYGQMDRPFVIGSLWNKQDKPPTDNEDGKNDKRLIQSRSGHTILFHDKAGEEKIVIADKTGVNTIVIDAKENSITIAAEKDFIIKANGNIMIEAAGDMSFKSANIALEAQEKVRIDARSGLGLSCAAGVKLNDGALEVK